MNWLVRDGLVKCLKHIQTGLSVVNISCLHYSRLSHEPGPPAFATAHMGLYFYKFGKAGDQSRCSHNLFYMLKFLELLQQGLITVQHASRVFLLHV